MLVPDRSKQYLEEERVLWFEGSRKIEARRVKARTWTCQTSTIQIFYLNITYVQRSNFHLATHQERPNSVEVYKVSSESRLLLALYFSLGSAHASQLGRTYLSSQHTLSLLPHIVRFTIHGQNLALKCENWQSSRILAQSIQIPDICLVFFSLLDAGLQLLFSGRFGESQETSHPGWFLKATEVYGQPPDIVERSVDLFGKRVESFVPVLVVVLVFAIESCAFADRGF